jgi:hypothetical protein
MFALLQENTFALRRLMGVCASEPHYIENRMRNAKRVAGNTNQNTNTNSTLLCFAFFETGFHVVDIAWAGENFEKTSLRVFALDPTNALTAMIGYL